MSLKSLMKIHMKMALKKKNQWMMKKMKKPMMFITMICKMLHLFIDLSTFNKFCKDREVLYQINYKC